MVSKKAVGENALPEEGKKDNFRRGCSVDNATDLRRPVCPRPGHSSKWLKWALPMCVSLSPVLSQNS